MQDRLLRFDLSVCWADPVKHWSYGLGLRLAPCEVVGRGNPGVKNLALPADSRPAVAFQFAA
jgi:hypothetical protein